MVMKAISKGILKSGLKFCSVLIQIAIGNRFRSMKGTKIMNKLDEKWLNFMETKLDWNAGLVTRLSKIQVKRMALFD